MKKERRKQGRQRIKGRRKNGRKEGEIARRERSEEGNERFKQGRKEERRREYPLFTATGIFSLTIHPFI